MLSPELVARFARHPTLVSGRLHVVNLDLLERHFGASWARVKARALAIAEQTILGGLGPQDLHIKVEEAKWLFFFPALDKQAAQIRCAMIAEKVFRRLIGDDARFDTVQVDTMVVEADGRLLMEAADPAVLVQSLIDQAVAEVTAPKPAETMPLDCVDEEEQQERKPVVPKGPPPQLQWTRREPEMFPIEVRFQFQPTWDAGRAVIATHACEPVREAPGGVQLVGYDTLTTGDDSPLVGDLDLAIFARARAAVRDLLRANDPGIIVFSVHCRTLEIAEARRRLTEALERSKPEERKLFAAELSGLPPGAPAHRIMHGVSFLRRYARAVFVRFPLSHPFFERLSGSGTYGVSFRARVPAAQAADRGKLYRRFAEQALRAGLKPVACGLRDRADVTAALEAGIVNLQGMGVQAPVAQPHGLRQFSLPGITLPRQAGAA